MKIKFPNKTTEEIVDACKNKLGDGKLLYSVDWYKNEDFYTKEKCRPGTFEVSDEIEHFGKSWNECNALAPERMLNFPEMIYFIQEYYKKHKKYPDSRWSWTSSRSSSGDLVDVGACDSGGVRVDDDEPGRSLSYLGVRMFKGAHNAYPTPSKDDTIEASIKKVKDAGYMVLKQL